MIRTLTQLILASVLFGGSALAEDPLRISQKGKTFSPDHVEISAGESLIVDNDDRTLHHVYIESPGFNYDSGEQEPGRQVRITFPKAGTYEVLCDIHPKMLLRVVVK